MDTEIAVFNANQTVTMISLIIKETHAYKNFFNILNVKTNIEPSSFYC